MNGSFDPRQDNPWLNCEKQGDDYICEEDRGLMKNVDGHFSLSHPPCPYNGTPEAPVYILMNNPAPPNDEDKKLVTDLDINMKMSGNKFIGFEYANSWWTEFFSGLMEPIGHYDKTNGTISDTGQKLIYNTFFAIEISGYYSKGFNHGRVAKLPSTQYSKRLVQNAQSKIFLKPRSNDFWYWHVPELATSEKLHVITGNRSPKLAISTAAPCVLRQIYSQMGDSALEKYYKFVKEKYTKKISGSREK